MTNPLGFVLPAASIGLGSITVKPRRGFFKQGTLVPFVRLPQATIEERHHDDLEITDHPVEQQASITDHAFKRPAEVIITCGWSNSPSPNGSLSNQAVGAAASVLGSTARTIIGAATTASQLLGQGAQQINAIYAQLLSVQESRVLFDVFTGKRKYTNMLFRSLVLTTDKKTENALFITAVCREVILVSVTTVSAVPINAKAQTFPEKTTPVQDQGRRQLTEPQSTPVTIKPFVQDDIQGTPLPDETGGINDAGIGSP